MSIPKTPRVPRPVAATTFEPPAAELRRQLEVCAAFAADLVSLVTNRYVGVAACAPALAQTEATAIGWLARELGLPAGAGGILTSGGSLSHLTAIVTARTNRLPEEFLSGSLYVSEEAHLSAAMAARIAGFPARAIRRIPVDGRCRMRVSADPDTFGVPHRSQHHTSIASPATKSAPKMRLLFRASQSGR